MKGPVFSDRFAPALPAVYFAAVTVEAPAAGFGRRTGV